MGVVHAADDWGGSNSSTAEEMRLDAEMWTELEWINIIPGAMSEA